MDHSLQPLLVALLQHRQEAVGVLHLVQMTDPREAVQCERLRALDPDHHDALVLRLLRLDHGLDLQYGIRDHQPDKTRQSHLFSEPLADVQLVRLHRHLTGAGHILRIRVALQQRTFITTQPCCPLKLPLMSASLPECAAFVLHSRA